MTSFLHNIGLGGLALLFVALIVIAIFLLKSVINWQGRELMMSKQPSSSRQKKFPAVNINHYRGLIFNFGLIVSLLTLIAIFEYPTYDKQELVELQGARVEMEDFIEIPPTEQKPPPPPKIKAPEIVAVSDEEVIEQEIEIDMDMEVSEQTVIEETEEVVVQQIEEEPEEEIEEVFQIVEDPAHPQGGYATFYAFISENLEYPRKALSLQISGKVYVKFIVDRDGSLSNIEVIRGIGAGCDEEAVRVLKIAPKWKPGKQRGRAVRQQMVIPIHFKMMDIEM